MEYAFDKVVKNLIQKERVKLEDRRKDDNDLKTYDEVFDRQTLLTLQKLISDELIETIDFPISTGKEANVFRCTLKNGFVAVKIFRVRNANFKAIKKYILGDKRFRGIFSDNRETIYTWAKKEFKNLKRMEEANVRVPKPIFCINNILLMEYIGTEELPAKMIKDVQLKNPKKVFDYIVRQMNLIYNKAELVHGDMSEYNILVNGKEFVIIDVGQSLLREHSLVEELLKRDVKNICRYFRKLGVKSDEGEVMERVKGE